MHLPRARISALVFDGVMVQDSTGLGRTVITVQQAQLTAECRPCGAQTMQSADHAECRPCRVRTMQSADHAKRRPCRAQTMQSADHAECRPCRVQTMYANVCTGRRSCPCLRLQLACSFPVLKELGLDFCDGAINTAAVMAFYSVAYARRHAQPAITVKVSTRRSVVNVIDM